MKLEEAIKQKAFKNEHQKMLINLLFTSNWLRAAQNVALKEYEISIQQFNILRILKGQFPKPAGINVLTERMLDRNSNASRLVDKLVNKELVDRKVCPSDRRKVEVLITKKGTALLDAATKCIEGMNAEMQVISASEAKKVNATLDKIRQIDYSHNK